MKKRILSLFLAVVLLFAALGQMLPTASAATYSGTCGDNLTWSLDTGTGVLTISGTGAMSDYSSGNYPPWYSYRNSITSVQFSNSITSIGAYAFYSCTALKSLTIPNSVTSIERYAFYCCNSLTSVTIPEGVTIIDSYTFYHCISLTSVTIPESVTSIGYSAFESCSSLTSVTIPQSVTSIANYAFYDCDSLANITIPDSVTSIGGCAFSNCDSLTSITIPISVTTIGVGAFSACDRLTAIYVDEANPSYCSDSNGIIFNKEKTKLIQYLSAYSGEYAVPDSVTSIGSYAFYGCSGLTSITIPDSVTSIGDDAFNKCTSLTSITIPDGVTSISRSVFYNCDSLTSVTIPDGVTSIGDYAFDSCDSLTSVTIPDSVTSIGHSAFYGCSSLTSLTIPDSVTIIGSWSFKYCNSLTDIYYGGTKLQWEAAITDAMESNVTVHFAATDATDAVTGFCGSHMAWSLDINTGALTIFGAGAMTDSPWSSYSDIITSVQINNGVTNIESGAFSDCSILTSVTIPDSVTSIGGSAFKSCSSLTSITIPDSVTSIGNSAFESCSNLTSLTIPDSVTSIGGSAFDSCTNLTSVKMGSSVTDIGNYAFEDCINLTSLTLPVGITTIGAGTFHNCDSLTSITIPDGVTTIGYYAFENCSNLISVTIPSSVTSIGQDAFYYCTSLTSVTFSNALKSIGSDAFAGCSSLTNVTIPGSVTSIGDSAFSNCGSLSAIWVDEENQYYSSDANGVLFNKEKTTLIQCPGGYSSSYVIPDSITSISNDAFYRCNSLTSVTIPGSVTSIGNYAFAYCNSLSAIWVDEENQYYSSDANGVLFNKTKTTLIQCPCGYSGSCIIPDSVTTLGSYAFFTRNNLTSILVDESNQYFSSDANGVLFNKGKTKLIRCPGTYSGAYTIPDGVTSIGSKAFYICDSLTSVTIPDSVTSIGDSAFCFCGSLKSATIGNSVKTINYSAFASCTSLSSVTIPNSVKSLGSWAFSECDSLTSVTIPDSVTSLDAATFYSCDNLTSVIIGNGLTTTALSMFEYCGSLTSITFGNSLTSIGAASFSDCTALTSITIPDGVTKVSSSAFKSCTSLLSVTIPNSVTMIDSYAFHDCSNLTSVMIPDGVTSIGQQAFSSCANLTSVTIPSSVTSIDYKAFYNCGSLANIYFAGTETQWTAAIASDAVGRNVTVHFGSTDAIEGTCGENLQWSLKNGVLKISGTGDMEDYNSYNTVPWYQYRLDFSSVTIDDGVTSIGNYAFYDCDNLISVAIPAGVTSIGKYAFGDCYTLTNVTFPDGLTSIGDYAFYYSCLSDAAFPDSLKTIGESAFSDCYCLTSVTIPAGVTSIGKYAFRFAATLTAFDVDEANLYYSSDDSGILFDKEKTTLIQCPRTYSGAYTIPDGVASIEAYAFPHCTELTSVTIPESVASIGESAFMDCSALTSITIPDSITSIGASAFRDCSSLTSITIPESVRSIEEYTFHFCNNLTDVYYGGTEAQWNEISISSVANSCLTDATIHFAKATIVDAALNPTMNLSAGAEMSVSYSFPASKVSEFEDFYLLVEKEMADGETVSTTYGVVEEKSTRSTDDRQPLTVKYHPETGEAMMYTVTYKGINAKEMGDSFTTTLYGVTADGTVYSSLVEATSMKDYLLSRFHAADASTELKTMVIDMLKYGAAAQGRLGYNTENLVTADLTEEELSYATQEIPEAVNHAASTGEGASVNTNITVGARVQLNLSCIYTTATAPETIKCIITDSEGKVLSEIATTNKNNIMFTAIYENVGAKEMRDVISATFYEGETAISKTISWSVESYVAQVRAKANVTEDELNMVNTMLTYGDSVAAYMKAK